MFGSPKDVEGECNAHLYIGDDYGDNSSTIRCQLAPKHEGLHKEEFKRGDGIVTIMWSVDERERCDHGCGQWDHDHRDESVKCPRDADDHEFSDCAFCHPGEEAKTCEACGKAYYDESEHKLRCPGQAFACTDCGENGRGVHVCPSSTSGAIDTFSEEP